MVKYIGITIGPIYETINETTKPAGLWFVSYMFSDITRRLCVEIFNGALKGQILSPYFDGGEEPKDGVGKYHDRIIFKTEHYDKAILDQIIQKVKKETIDIFPSDWDKKEDRIEFLIDYLQINYVVMDEDRLPVKNSILALSPFLDSIELLKTTPLNQGNNPFEKLFKESDRDDRSSNEEIKKSPLFKGVAKEENQFFSGSGGKRIRDIEDISSIDSAKEYKKTKYFATVFADGDGMGAFLESLDNDDDVKVFSKACLEYDKVASEAIGKFGGMTIYAGGDDLLFLSPLEGEIEGKQGNILSLCSNINECFQSIVSKAFEGRTNVIDKIPTISFGVAIRYYKFPLYEALSNARDCLYYVKTKTEKNSIALHLEKHSGQSMVLLIPHESVWFVDKMFNFNTNSESNIELGPESVNSVIYTLENMKALIKVLDEQNLSKEEHWNLWKNFFDNPEQKKDGKYHEFISSMYVDLKNLNKRIRSLAEEQSQYDALLTFTTLLRIEKFLKEKKGD